MLYRNEVIYTSKRKMAFYGAEVAVIVVGQIAV